MNGFSHPCDGNLDNMENKDRNGEGSKYPTYDAKGINGVCNVKTLSKITSTEKSPCLSNGGPVQSPEVVSTSGLIANGEIERPSSSMAPACEPVSPTKKSRTQLESEYFEGMRTQCTKAINLSADYLQGVAKHRVFPQVEPGYLRPLLPQEAPNEPEPWDQIFDDVHKLLMPGVAHWNHPHFHAYLAAANSYPALCADIISTAIGGIGFTWASSPVSTELEVVMLDWMAKLLNLPEFFLSHTEGGGVIQGTSSESSFVSLLAARNVAIEKYLRLHPNTSKFEIQEKLVGYHSDQAHASVERAGLLSLLRFRSLPCNEKFELDGPTLRKAVEEDVANGLIPFYCVATLGTTATCSYDRLPEIGPICQEYDMWLHVDAAYAGSALICPEFHRLMPGLEYISSFAFNPHKWLLMNFDLSIVWDYSDEIKSIDTCHTFIGLLSALNFGAIDRPGADIMGPTTNLTRDLPALVGLWHFLIIQRCQRGWQITANEPQRVSCDRLMAKYCVTPWLKNSQTFVNAFTVDASYLQHAKLGKMPDFRNWHIPFGRRFRSLKIWFVLRAYGVSGLQKYIRNHVEMAHYLERLFVEDGRFEIVGEVTLGLVCFRIKNDNARTRTLYERIEADGRLHLVPSYIRHPTELFFIRVAICYMFVDKELTRTSFNVISDLTTEILQADGTHAS